MIHLHLLFSFFFFNDTATTEIYTLSLHDALPILGACKILSSKKVYSSVSSLQAGHATFILPKMKMIRNRFGPEDRKSTRLNSSHGYISYAVFCLKKKKKTESNITIIAYK